MEKSVSMYLRNLIQLRCNPQRALQPVLTSFRSSRDIAVGHLYALAFQPAGQELEADLSVVDPENPDKKIQAVGLIENVDWSGPNAVIKVSMRVSSKNKAIIQEALCLPKEPLLVEAQWAVYDYDFPAGKYFKVFYTIDKPLVLGLEHSVYINNYAEECEGNFLHEIYLPLLPEIEYPRSGIRLYFPYGRQGI